MVVVRLLKLEIHGRRDSQQSIAVIAVVELNLCADLPGAPMKGELERYDE